MDSKNEIYSAEVYVGKRIRSLRNERGYSLRTLAEISGLNVNTLSMIENGKTSASIGTLQQISLALEVPISYFFETASEKKYIVFTKSTERPLANIGVTQMYDLARNLAGDMLQPLILKLETGMNSGSRMTAHLGQELVFCLEGKISYHVDREEFDLEKGDCLVFDAALPHCWENKEQNCAEILLIFFSPGHKEKPDGFHYKLTHQIKESSMKIAVITDDGKTVSKHFGRAKFYAVLTIEEAQVANQEMRPKLGHGQFGGHEHGTVHSTEGHGHDAESHSKHQQMAENIADCEVVICGGMGMGAYESLRRLNIKPVVTDLSDIDSVAQAFIAGTLVDHQELLH